MKRLSLLLATGAGVGFAPVIPGTFGSALGVLIFFIVERTTGPYGALAATVVAAGLGFWTAGAAEAQLGTTDPGPVVIDEIAGQMLTLLFLPSGWTTLLAGFLLFRVLDVTKPFPARRLETLHGGAGIMADDLCVAVYANLLLQVAFRAAPAWLGTT